MPVSGPVENRGGEHARPEPGRATQNSRRDRVEALPTLTDLAAKEVPMDRMSPLDASFLHVEDAVSHMHIGSVAIFEGPSPAPEDFARMVDAKLSAVPRYRQKVRFVPLQLGRPVWVDDPHFQLGYHLRHS